MSGLLSLGNRTRQKLRQASSDPYEYANTQRDLLRMHETTPIL
jgi:hypothetical protein